jgi:hypothetical protein
VDPGAVVLLWGAQVCALPFVEFPYSSTVVECLGLVSQSLGSDGLRMKVDTCAVPDLPGI